MKEKNKSQSERGTTYHFTSSPQSLPTKPGGNTRFYTDTLEFYHRHQQGTSSRVSKETFMTPKAVHTTPVYLGDVPNNYCKRLDSRDKEFHLVGTLILDSYRTKYNYTWSRTVCIYCPPPDAKFYQTNPETKSFGLKED